MILRYRWFLVSGMLIALALASVGVVLAASRDVDQSPESTQDNGLYRETRDDRIAKVAEIAGGFGGRS